MNILIENNYFNYGNADFGGFLHFESFFSMLILNNTFIYGIGVAYFGLQLGSGASISIMGANTQMLNIYRGVNNKYLDGYCEMKGNFVHFLVVKLRFFIGGVYVIYVANFSEFNSLFYSKLTKNYL